MHRYLLLFILFSVCSIVTTAQTPTIAEKTKGATKQEGFFNFYWSETEGKIYLEVPAFDREFIYVNSLTGGVGSNDIGLDRNQLGNTRVVKFIRSGNKVLLLQPNYGYRAVSDNPEEARSVEEAFAQSVLFGTGVVAESDGRVLIDLTDFIVRDAHGVQQRLKGNRQGSYSLSKSRSAIWMPRTKNFPKNTEFEALLTFTGSGAGQYLREVAPSTEAITVRQHHSFVELPDDNYQPRPFDPRSGFFGIDYQDYATPIGTPLTKRFISRHRLQKKTPGAERSEAVEPIVYYLDRGAPEPIRSALLEGASWWNEAFEAAGYTNAFQVKILPEGADPMDVRYNVINWVHRKTRGWSYGSAVTDPRTGEIIKGHVLLGSLRVRQDYLIAQGLLEQAYDKAGTPDPRLLELALARLRQLSAHEVGHTLGIAHNFAASTNGRASVMDYPHPYVTTKGDALDLSKAYDTGIGEWDKQAVRYGYTDFAPGTNEQKALNDILEETEAKGLRYISDSDARPVGGANASGHLWDNGADPAEELNRLLRLRRRALSTLDQDNLAPGQPLYALEDVLVPVYLMHRYQVEATAKLIGGVQYTYASNDGSGVFPQPVGAKRQEKAVQALLKTLQPSTLSLPDYITKMLTPPPPGYGRGRENFQPRTGPVFDPIAAAEASAEHTLSYLLHPNRLERIAQQAARNSELMDLDKYLDEIRDGIVKTDPRNDTDKLIRDAVEHRYVLHLIRLFLNDKHSVTLRTAVWKQLGSHYYSSNNEWRPNNYYGLLIQRALDHPESFKVPPAPKLPDGSPIGCGH